MLLDIIVYSVYINQYAFLNKKYTYELIIIKYSYNLIYVSI